jgi:hypothetical protein
VETNRVIARLLACRCRRIWSVYRSIEEIANLITTTGLEILPKTAKISTYTTSRRAAAFIYLISTTSNIWTLSSVTPSTCPVEENPPPASLSLMVSGCWIRQTGHKAVRRGLGCCSATHTHPVEDTRVVLKIN